MNTTNLGVIAGPGGPDGLRIGATLEQLTKALMDAPRLAGDPRLPESVQKSTFAQAGSATSGLTFYDLELGAKFLYPVLTPLRNEIPRVSGKGGIQANWRAVTGVNTGNISVGVSGGNRNAVAAITTQDYTAAYKGIGIEDNVDFEAQYAGQGFDDIRAIAGRVGLEMLMLGEEAALLAGNATLQLGTASTVTGFVNSTTGGALSNGTYYVRVVALTADGYLRTTVASGCPGQLTRTNADGTTDTYGGGNSQISASASTTLSGGTSTQTIAASWAAVKGAVAYAVFWGASAAGATIGAIVTTPTYTITTATGAGTQTAADTKVSSDFSTNSLIFDGLITQSLKTGSNSYYADLGGATFTADGAGGIVEIDAALKSFWDNYRLTPDTIWVSSQEALNISRDLLKGNANGAYRIVFNPEQGMVMGGVMVASYLNRFSMAGANVLKVRLHPNMPPGTVLFTTTKLPYPISNVTNVFQVRSRQEYYMIEWPLRTRKYEYGVYADQVLQHYFPPSMGVITGIGNG